MDRWARRGGIQMGGVIMPRFATSELSCSPRPATSFTGESASLLKVNPSWVDSAARPQQMAANLQKALRVAHEEGRDLSADQVQITQILKRIAGGDKAAPDDLFDVAYAELRRLAGKLMKGQALHHSLQPTALVGEMYLKLFKQEDPSWEDRRHFFNAAARAMRSVLVDHARKKQTKKRSAEGARLPIEALVETFDQRAGDLMALDLALEGFEKDEPNLSEIVHLRFFGGMTIKEVASATGRSDSSIERDIQKSRTFLRVRIENL